MIKQKFFSLLMATCMCIASIPFEPMSLTAVAATENGLTYVIRNGEATITGYSGSINSTKEPQDVNVSGMATTLTIPETLGGCPVTTIDYFAFHNSYALEEIILPSSLREIGENAFYYG